MARKLASGRVGTGLSPPGFLGGVLGREPFELLGREPVEPRGGKRLPLPEVDLNAKFGFSILRS